jgi:hypothetical protein
MMLKPLFTFTLLVGCSNKSTTDDSGNVKNDTSSINDSTPVEPELNIWTGSNITFTKESNADPTDPANQDSITDNVKLTRGQQGSLFNVVIESSAGNNSPEGTEWAKGTTDDIEILEFQPLKSAANNQLKNVPGESFVLHLIEEDIYIDLTFISWESGGSGGSFSYERSTQ